MVENEPRPVFVLAEAGVNHDGSLEKALKLVDIAREANVDAVKFQTFKPGECTGRFAFMTEYQKEGAVPDESRYEMSARLALTYDDFRAIAAHCKKVGILFLSTPDGFESLDFLVDEIGIPIIKVGSTEITNIPYLKAIGHKNLPVILSTGLSTLGEVEAALSAVREGCDKNITVLHCTSEYPAPIDEINLRAMTTMARAFNVDVGLSDHSQGPEASIAAVALGATIIEKHYTLDTTLPGPDHKASMGPAELKAFVTSIRRTEALLGNGIKQPTASELANMQSIRRSVVAGRSLEKGAVLTLADLACKRPGHGIQPAMIDELVGKRLLRDMQDDEVFQWKDVE